MPVVNGPGFTTQLTCFSRTKVQIQTLEELRGRAAIRAFSQFTCFTSTKVQITPEGRCVAGGSGPHWRLVLLLSLLALLVQKYRY